MVDVVVMVFWLVVVVTMMDSVVEQISADSVLHSVGWSLG
jgi:hypothetical protein